MESKMLIVQKSDENHQLTFDLYIFTPRKTVAKEPENARLEKEKHRPKPLTFGFHVLGP